MNNNSGAWGEAKARAYLLKHNYEILATNYHSRFGEIDIIAKQDNTLCFIEVKTRKQNSLYQPIEAVTSAKQMKIVQTAQIYLLKEKLLANLACRFDVIEVVYYNRYIFTINHLKEAFEL